MRNSTGRRIRGYIKDFSNFMARIYIAIPEFQAIKADGVFNR
jgi:hypothetical protein